MKLIITHIYIAMCWATDISVRSHRLKKKLPGKFTQRTHLKSRSCVCCCGMWSGTFLTQFHRQSVHGRCRVEKCIVVRVSFQPKNYNDSQTQNPSPHGPLELFKLHTTDRHQNGIHRQTRTHLFTAVVL